MSNPQPVPTILVPLEALESLLEAGTAHLVSQQARGVLLEERASEFRKTLREMHSLLALAKFDARFPTAARPMNGERLKEKEEISE